jgi:hypothetical protein
MLEAKFAIMVRTASGEVFEAFRWCRDEASGIARAWTEAKRFGVEASSIWAVAL